MLSYSFLFFNKNFPFRKGTLKLLEKIWPIALFLTAGGEEWVPRGLCPLWGVRAGGHQALGCIPVTFLSTKTCPAHTFPTSCCLHAPPHRCPGQKTCSPCCSPSLETLNIAGWRDGKASPHHEHQIGPPPSMIPCFSSLHPSQ